MKKKTLTDYSGQSIIEMTIILLFVILPLLFGAFEFGRAIHAKNIIINMAREGANLVSRTTEDPQNIMDALATTAGDSVKMDPNGMMYLTKVSGMQDGKIRIFEQYRWDDLPAGYPRSKVSDIDCAPWVNDVCTPSPGDPDSRPEVNYSVLNLDPCDLGGAACPNAQVQIAYTAEVFYDYEVIFKSIIDYSTEMYSITVF